MRGERLILSAKLPYVDELERWVSNDRAASTVKINQIAFFSKNRQSEEELQTPYHMEEMCQVKFDAQHFIGQA